LSITIYGIKNCDTMKKACVRRGKCIIEGVKGTTEWQ
jgi:hypothetical protein